MGKYRDKPQINNYNPYNKLNLNQYHQVDRKPKEQSLHKKKRDLQRLLQHRRQKGQQIKAEKEQELQKLQQKFQDKKKNYEKGKRKEFFLTHKYQAIMNIQLKKVRRRLTALRASDNITKQIEEEITEMIKKQNYIKHFPKNLKYVSLFPTSKPLQQQALKFQNKLIQDIDLKIKTKNQALNSYTSENEVKVSKKKKRRDDFFIQVQSEPQEKQEVQ